MATLARIEFVSEDKPAVAELSDRREWSCTDPTWRGLLNDRVRTVDFGPSQGDAVREHVEAMAKVLGGKPMIRPRPTMPPGTVY